MITLGRTSRRRDVSTVSGEGVAARAGFDLADAYDHHGGPLYGFAFNALRDRGASEDCVQEVFLRAWRSREHFDADRASTRTWLFAIARNVIADALRTRRRLPVTEVDEQLIDVPVHDADPVDRLGLTEALALLSLEQRQAVVAVHLVGMSYGELSGSLGIPVATLRTRTFYGLRALRRHLDEREG